jgi:undecaprenyl diphosphate synthase
MTRLPAHVAIIMDGNGRWAKKRLLNRVKGHERGVETVRNIVRASREIGIKALTLYAFSTENWQRPKAEVQALMLLLERFLKSERAEILDNNVRLGAIGQIHRLPKKTLNALEDLMAATAGNDGLKLNLALSYGGRAELLEMVCRIARAAKDGRIDPDAIDESMVADHLYTRGLPDPDLLIRTSGEMRLSNFLLWQVAYSEIFVTDTLWPDFSREEYLEILMAYQRRDRRFGKVDLS